MKAALAIGSALSLGGIGGLLWWRSKRAAASEPKTPNETNNPPVYYASLRQGTLDEDVGGGWAMLDVRGLRDPKFDPDTDVHVGHIASLFLRHGDADVKVFNVRVIGITGDDFNGQWVSGRPAGGPQMVDFRGAHIFSIH